MHFLPAGTGIWPPAFPLRSPRGRCIPLQLPGLCSPWRAVHSLPARRGGPCNTKPGAGAPFFCIPLLPYASRACNGRWGIQKNRMIFIIRFFVAEREGFEPPDPLRSTVFKTAAIDHSATSPSALGLQM